MAMLCRGSPRAAYFYEAPDTSTFRYRAYNIWQSLAAELPGGPSASWFHNGDLDQIKRFLDQCDVLVLSRVRYTDQIGRMIAWARSRNRRVLFDVDDLVFDACCTHIVMDTLEVDFTNPLAFDVWFASVGRLGATMNLCDGVVVTNSYLATRAEAFLGKPASIIPNYLNREQTEASAAIWNAKDRTGWARDDRIHLGYFSGTPTHNRDFALLARALAGLMDEDTRVYLRVVGFLNNLDPELDRHRARIETIPLQDFVNLQREIGCVEINLVPLQDNVFTNCKSELKWFEAAVVGAVTIASPTQPYRQAIQHGQNGWLAPAHAWDEVLREVIDGGPTLWHTVAARARNDAIARFGWDNQARGIRAAIFGETGSARTSNRSPVQSRQSENASRIGPHETHPSVRRSTKESLSGNSRAGSEKIRHHVVISGTGRAGTSFLVYLLTQLGLHTGFQSDGIELPVVERAGLEVDIRDCKAPYIIKNPWLCEYIDEVLSDPLIQIDYAIVPVREFAAAAESRAYVQETTTGSRDGETVNGGLWGTDKAAEQETVLRHRFTSLMEALARHDVPITFLWYPRLTQDAAYVYNKLSFLLGGCDFASFLEVFERVRRPELVHHFTSTDN